MKSPDLRQKGVFEFLTPNASPNPLPILIQW